MGPVPVPVPALEVAGCCCGGCGGSGGGGGCCGGSGGACVVDAAARTADGSAVPVWVAPTSGCKPEPKLEPSELAKTAEPVLNPKPVPVAAADGTGAGAAATGAAVEPAPPAEATESARVSAQPPCVLAERRPGGPLAETPPGSACRTIGEATSDAAPEAARAPGTASSNGTKSGRTWAKCGIA